MGDDFEFDIPKELKPELDATYDRLEVIVRQIKKLKEKMIGFKDIVDAYKPLYLTLQVFSRALDPDVSRVIGYIVSIGLGMIVLLIIMPMLSGFTRLPWPETLILFVALIGLAFINMLKEKLGVV